MPFSGNVPITMHFTNTSSNTFDSYLWLFGDGDSSTDENPEHDYTVAGTYVVSLTGTTTIGDEVTFYDTLTLFAENVDLGESAGWQQPDPAYIGCPGFDPQVMLRISNDGGKNWITMQPRSAGKTGEYHRRVRWNRLGMGRRRVFEVTVADPYPWKITGAYLKADPEER